MTVVQDFPKRIEIDHSTTRIVDGDGALLGFSATPNRPENLTDEFPVWAADIILPYISGA